MKFSIDQDALSLGVKSVQRLVGATLITCVAEGNFLRIIGVNNSNSAALTVPIEPGTKSKFKSFSLETDLLLGAISKKKVLQMTVEDSALIIDDSKTKYHAELVTQHFDIAEVVPADIRNAKEGVVLKAKFIDLVEKFLPKIELKPLLATYSNVPIGIKASKEGTFIGSFDFYQAAFFHDPSITGNVEFLLPGAIFSVLYKEMKGQSYKVVPTESTVYAFNDVFEAAFARPQEDGDTIGLDEAILLYHGLKDQKPTRIKVAGQPIIDILENGRSLYEADANFKFTAKGDRVKIVISSSRGKVEGTIKLEAAVKRDVEFTCDFTFFAGLISKGQAVVDLMVSPQFLLVKNDPITYVLTLK